MNDQYIRPINSEVPTDDDARRLVDESFESFATPLPVSQEQEAGPYRYHKQLEARIEHMRASATEAHLSRGTIMERVLERFTTTPKPLETRLIEQESIIGGNALPRHETVEKLIARQRFWYYQENWYHEQVWHDQRRFVYRYQITETDVSKLIEGREVPFLEGEREHFLSAVELYHREVLQNLYSK